MPLIDILLPEFDRETGTTRRVLERVPESAFGWKPHARSMTLGALAAHLAALPTWTATVMNGDAFDIADEPAGHDAQPASAADLLSTFDENVASARALLLNRSDGELTQSWTLKRGTHDVFMLPRIAMLRYFVLNHLIHHRGQLSVYLRLQGVAVPAMYGPSADEGGF